MLPQLGERVSQPVLVALEATLQFRDLSRHLLKDALAPRPFALHHQDLKVEGPDPSCIRPFEILSDRHAWPHGQNVLKPTEPGDF